MSGPGTSVIVGFDGSAESRDAVALAKEVARSDDADLHVCFVQWDDDHGAEQARFQRLFSEARRDLGPQPFIEEPIRDMDASSGLRNLAERLSADLIAIGATNRGTAGRILLGSVGEKLLHSAPCAVAVAPRGWAVRESFELAEIGVAYNGSPEALLALDHATSLARGLGSDLTLIGVNEMPDGEELTAAIARAGDRAGPGLDTTIVAESGDPADVLARHSAELDLLVIGSRGRGPMRQVLLGSVSSKLIRLASCPVLVTPRGAVSEQ